MKLLTLTLGAALVLAAVPAQASFARPNSNISGAYYYSRCGGSYAEYRPRVVAACEDYVAGIAYDLQYERRACLPSYVSRQQQTSVAVNWIYDHRRYGNRRADYMIRNGLANAYPCRATSPSWETAHQFEETVKFFGAVKTLITLLY